MVRANSVYTRTDTRAGSLIMTWTPPSPYPNDAPPPPPPSGPPPGPRRVAFYRRPVTWASAVAVTFIVLFIAAVASSGGGSAPRQVAAAPPTVPASAPAVPTVDPVTAAASTPPPQEDAPLPLGEPALLTSDEGLTESAVVHTVAPYVSDNQFTQPDQGAYLVADVHQKVDSGSTPYNIFYWHLQAPDGTTYDPTNAKDPSFGSGELAAGQQTRGFVTFDVPPGTVHGLILLSDPLGSQLASWRF